MGEEAVAGNGEWVLGTRIRGDPENRKRIELLMEHASLKYGSVMKEKTMSEFLRFLINYYYSMEITGKKT